MWYDDANWYKHHNYINKKKVSIIALIDNKDGVREKATNLYFRIKILTPPLIDIIIICYYHKLITI